MKELHAPSGGKSACATAAARLSGPRLRASGVALALALTIGAPAARAQEPPAPPPAPDAPRSSAASIPQRTRGAPRTATYEDAASQRSFVVDRSGASTLMQVEDSPEVFVLNSTTAQRGDAFLRTDAGQLMLRVTEQGNVISYVWDKDGAPADIAGVASPLNRPGMTTTLAERLKEARDRLTFLAGHDVTIFGAAQFASQEEWVADALMVMVFGIEQANGAASKSAQKVHAVRIVHGDAPGATLVDGELVLSLNPAEGYGGRPSSGAIAKVIVSSK